MNKVPLYSVLVHVFHRDYKLKQKLEASLAWDKLSFFMSQQGGLRNGNVPTFFQQWWIKILGLSESQFFGFSLAYASRNDQTNQ